MLSRFLGRVNARTGTPAAALVANAVVGVAAIASRRTDDLIVLSVFGALTLYALSMLSLFALRRRTGTTLLLITHDRDLAARCDRQVHLSDGQVDAAVPA